MGGRACYIQLVDNAQDGECCATTVWVEGVQRGYKGKPELTVEDDGIGLDMKAAVRSMP